MIDSNWLFPMKPLEFKIFLSVETYDEQTVENYRNSNVAEKRIVSKLSKISIPNFDSTSWTLEWRLRQKFTSLSLYFPRNKPSNSVTVGSVRFIVFLNDSASPKMITIIFLHFFRFFLKAFCEKKNVVEATHT